MMMRRRRSNPNHSTSHPLWTGAAIIGAGVLGGYLANLKLESDIASNKYPGWPAGASPDFLDPIWQEYVGVGAAVGIVGGAIGVAALTKLPTWQLGVAIVVPVVLGLSAFQARADVLKGVLSSMQSPSTSTAIVTNP